MFFSIKRLLTGVFIFSLFCFSVYAQVSSQERVRINDFSLFFDDERIVLRGTSDYHYISDPRIYAELFPNNFDILINGSGGVGSNFLRLWMEGASNTSGAWKAGDPPHPTFGTASYNNYALREQQPFMCTNYLDPNVTSADQYNYNLTLWPDYTYPHDGNQIPKYEDRLMDILFKARENEVFVMLTLFDTWAKKDTVLWQFSAWNPERNSQNLGEFLPYNSSPYPGDVGSESVKCFYNIWEWEENTIDFETLNWLGEKQKEYVQRIAGKIPASYWNVIFEIENEPVRVIAHTGQGEINLSARWAYQVAKWIKEVRPNSLVAFNAHGDPSIRRALFTLDQGANRMIDIVSIHASYYAGNNDHWQLDDPNGWPYYGNYADWENAEKVYIREALDRIREDSLAPIRSRFYMIDSDGDSGNSSSLYGVYDNNAERVKQIAGIASIFGAGYNNKFSSIVDFDDPSFDETLLKLFHDKINERFFDEIQGWKYGKYANQDPNYRRNYFENNAIRCLALSPIIKADGSPYTLGFQVINNGTYEDMIYVNDEDDSTYFLYDTYTKQMEPIRKTLEKVYPPSNWTIPISNLGNNHKKGFFMEFPAPEEGISYIKHELFIIKNPTQWGYERVGGDTLEAIVFFQ